MRVVQFLSVLISLILTQSVAVRAQDAPRLERLLGIGSRQKPAAPLPVPQGLQDHVANASWCLVWTTASARRFRTTPTYGLTAHRLNSRKTTFIAPTDRSIRWSPPVSPTVEPSPRPSHKFKELRFSTPWFKRPHSVTRRPFRLARTSRLPSTRTNCR